MKIKILKTINAGIDGKSIHLEAGKEYEIEHADALHLVNGWYAVEIKPAVKIEHKPAGRSSVKIAKE